VKWPPAPEANVRAFARATARLCGVEPRKMFGYPAVFVNGNMIAGLVRDRMVIRLDAVDRERFLTLPGATPFVAMKGRVMKQWAVVPPTMLKSPARLGRWLGRALAHGRALPPKPVRRRPRSAAR
jgi:TfoX/Sxy family transcriptional regulator of competence genes